MFCRNCGKEIDNRAVVCPHCGVQLGNVNNYVPVSKPTYDIAIVGFVLSFVLPIVGLIISIIAYRKCRDENLEGKNFALAGIIIGAIIIAIIFLAVLSIIGLSCMLAVLGSGGVY